MIVDYSQKCPACSKVIKLAISYLYNSNKLISCFGHSICDCYTNKYFLKEVKPGITIESIEEELKSILINNINNYYGFTQ